MRLSSEHTDLVLRGDGEADLETPGGIPCHRLVLASVSPYFRAMFRSEASSGYMEWTWRLLTPSSTTATQVHRCKGAGALHIMSITWSRWNMDYEMIPCGLNIICQVLFYKLGTCLEVFYLFLWMCLTAASNLAKSRPMSKKSQVWEKKERKHACQVFFRKRTKGSPNIYQYVIFKPILLHWYVILSKEACPKWKVGAEEVGGPVSALGLHPPRCRQRCARGTLGCAFTTSCSISLRDGVSWTFAGHNLQL